MRPIIHCDMLRQHCRALVLAKEWDDARMNGHEKKRGRRIELASATWPHTWVLIQLGLWNWWAHGGGSSATRVEEPELVDPWQVASGTVANHKSYYDDAPMSVELAEDINDPEHHDPARYAQLHPLPLYWASEGKNRVFLFRIADVPIRATIERLSLPTPDRMAIGTIGIGPFKFWLLDADGALDVIHQPDRALPIWLSYGIKRRFKLPVSRFHEVIRRWWSQRSRLYSDVLID
ncbi:hypothetical protein [Magnetospirillum sp. 64-120]|uniref:hypothetical protein n=1 Tax=Magnetospirillum sp. 64-120 TaxID=1895778 RepID=UPI0025BC0910|nr:hypothetical protein [Magnetospirillum sp. 64-120]